MANNIDQLEDTSPRLAKRPSLGMQSFASHTISFGTELNKTYGGDLEQPVGINLDEITNFASKALSSRQPPASVNHTGVLQTGGLNKAQQPTDFTATVNNVESRSHPSHRGAQSWEESVMADTSPRATDTSTDVDTDDKGNHRTDIAVHGSDSNDKSKDKNGDQKTLRRLAQNREAARKSRLRKKGLAHGVFMETYYCWQGQMAHRRGPGQYASLKIGEKFLSRMLYNEYAFSACSCVCG